MRNPFLIVLIAGIGAFAAYALYRMWTSPPRQIVEHATAVATSKYGRGSKTARTRKVAMGAVNFWEVELPGGAWIDCGGDCSEAFRRASLDYYEEHQDEVGGRK